MSTLTPRDLDRALERRFPTAFNGPPTPIGQLQFLLACLVIAVAMLIFSPLLGESGRFVNIAASGPVGLAIGVTTRLIAQLKRDRQSLCE